jgi:hypothetical protein
MEFASLFKVQSGVIVIDSLNSFYHLVSMEDSGSRGKKLLFALASLSHFARANGSSVIITMYRRDGSKSSKGRSISNMSDITASVDLREDNIQIRLERGSAWPGGLYSSRSP